MATQFEKVMNACLQEHKKTTATSKKVVESKRTSAKANVAKSAISAKGSKKIAESRKVMNKKMIRESEEEFDNEFIGNEDEEMADIADDVMVVVDPEIDADEIETVADEIQGIIDATPDGEEPTTDDYIGDNTYICPDCGNAFFYDGEISGECPVCGNEPEDFVFAGEVASSESAVEDNAEELEADIPEEVEDDEELEADIPDDEEFESCGRSRKGAKKAPKAKSKNERKTVKARDTGYALDESTFNPFMTKFIRENYKNAKSFTMRKATVNPKTHTLTVECVLTMKSGAKKSTILKFEGFNPNKKVLFAKDASRTFKCESKNAPFCFSVKCVGKVLKCEGLKYNFTTKSVKENKRLQVSGNLIRESKVAKRQTKLKRI